MSEKKNNNKQNELGIEINETIAEGIYSNLVMVGHSSSEFILDFIRMFPGVQSAKVKSRIILTPDHATRLLNTLKDNIRKYEEVYGEISNVEDSTNVSKIPMNFGGPVGEA